MSKTVKDIVRSFYETDFVNNIDALSEYLHPDIELQWVSSFGFSKKKFDEIRTIFSDIAQSFETLTCEITQLISENNKVSVQYTYYGNPIEVPNKELTIAHFMAIWEVKDEKLYKGYQISQHGDNAPQNV
ncbi:nuclear transport factor 2 family protein [Aquimarina pacifica]|uniref:nuclear transport factor 2 family protein n=1 Tax=Aquimarina pacifica TaxID=1296415 RepID=UPI0004707EEC|nr:nuclear transport factor 2 family protein [Aquimarina pacifica]